MPKLGLGLGLNKGRGLFGFNPLSLDPYLLFDSRSSMKGELEATTLDLDPSNPDSLDVITASRSGVATYTDADGLIQTADPNTVRVDHVQGEELTPTKYQNIPYTDFSSGWSNYLTSDTAGGGYNGYPSRVVTADSNTAKYFTSIPSVNNVTYTLSFYIRRISGSGTISCFHSSAANGNQTDITATSEWTRQEVTYLGDGGNISAGVRIVTAGDVVEIAMPQVEEGTTATDFVPNTTGSPKFITGPTYGPRVPMMLIEPSATNLWSYSDLSSGMTNNSRTTLVSNYADSPLGPNTASQLKATESTTFNDELRTRTGQFTVNSGESTVSIFAKADTRSNILIHIEGFDGGILGVKFDLLDGSVISVATGLTANTEYVSDGWYRLSFTFTTTSDLTGDVRIIVYNDSWQGYYPFDGTESVLLTGLQVESGSVATSYIPQRINLLDNSYFDNWTGLSVNKTLNAGVSPSGVNDAVKLIENTGNTYHGTALSFDIPDGKDVNISFYAKAAGRTKIALRGEYLSTSDFSAAEYDLLNGTSSVYTSSQSTFGVVSSAIEDAGNGWYRCSLSYTSKTGLNFPLHITMSNGGNLNYMDGVYRYAGDGTSGILLWGPQITEGLDLFGFQNISNGLVVRNADNLVIDGTAFSDFYNATEGTWYCEVVPKGNDGSATYTFILEYGVDNNDRVGFFYYPSDGHQSITGFSSGSTFYNQDAYGDATNQLTRMSYSYKSGNHKSAINGTSASDTDAVVVSANQLFLGRRIHSGNNGKLIGHIKRLIYWPTHSDSL